MMYVDDESEVSMLDAGGDPIERDTERRPLRPVYRRPQPTRPTSRPLSVWIIALVLTSFAVLGTYSGIMALVDAVDHGDEDEVVAAFGLIVLLSVAQLVMAGGLFAGARWGRTGALALCVVNLGLAAVAAMTETVGSGQLWFVVTIDLVVMFALLGPRVYAWTGGDRPSA